MLESRRQELISFAPETDTVQVDADPARLQQVVDNFMHNATKFTPPAGRIEVLVQLEQTEVVLRIRDSGIRIPPEMLACVFDLFAQADHYLDRAQGGLGIGLTLIKGLVEMHGGRVRHAATVQGKVAGSKCGYQLCRRAANRRARLPTRQRLPGMRTC